MFAVVLLLMGPIMLILGITESGKEDTTFWIVAGAILTIIGICVLVSIFGSKGKSSSSTKPSPTANMTPQQRLAYLQQQNAIMDAKLDAKFNKPASVVKRGVAGTIIGGVPGAIIGAASAIDKNNRNRK